MGFNARIASISASTISASGIVMMLPPADIVFIPGSNTVNPTAKFVSISVSVKKPHPEGCGLRFYLTNAVDRVVDQLSPGFRMAAAGFSVHSVEPFSGLGRLCQGSMHTNLGSPGLDQIRV